jgi:hypothetical protein
MAEFLQAKSNVPCKVWPFMPTKRIAGTVTETLKAVTGDVLPLKSRGGRLWYFQTRSYY